jgi:ABC-type branched-subunit amino acid transport system substrate-binding protein
MASWGKQTQAGARLALKELHAAGQDVDIVFGDTQLQAKSAVSEVMKALTTDKVEAVFSEFTPTTVAIAPVLVQRNVLLLYSAAAASPLTMGGSVYKTYMNYIEACSMTASEFKKKGVKSPALLKSINEFGELCLQGMKQVFENPIVVEYSTGDDLRTQILALKKQGADCVINPAFIPDFSRMLKAMAEIRFQPFVAANHDAMDPKVMAEYPEGALRAYSFSLPQAPTAFLQRITAEGFSDSNENPGAMMLGYLHTKQLLQAARSCADAGKRGDGSCVADSLAHAPADPAFGFQGWKDRQAAFDLRFAPWVAP